MKRISELEERERKRVIDELIASLWLAKDCWKYAVGEGLVSPFDNRMRAHLFDRCVPHVASLVRDLDDGASERQLSYFFDLCQRRGVEPEKIAMGYGMECPERMSRAEMSKAIDRLRNGKGNDAHR